MNREDEICLTLQGLIKGIDYETGEVVEFSDKVKDSLKVIAATFECLERCQQISNVSESEQSKVNDWDMVSGTFKEIIQTIKSDRPNHLVIIQNGYFYDVLGEDATFFVDRFSYNPYDLNGVIRVGFPINSKKVFSNLREMKQSFVLVSQLPKGEGEKVRRAISDIYDGDDDTFNDVIVNNGKPSDGLNNDYFKIESYSKVRLLNRSWRGDIQNIKSLRLDNQKNSRLLNSGFPFTVEEVELFKEMANQGKSKNELIEFFQRNIDTIDKAISKDKIRLSRGYKELIWSDIDSGQIDACNYEEDDKQLDLDNVDNPCVDCECEIPQARIDNVPGVVRCASCQSKFEVANPDSVARKVEEKFGTRDDFKNMRGRQFGVNVQNKN